MTHVTWREQVEDLKQRLLEHMYAQLNEREREVYAACTRFGVTDKNRDDVLDLLDRTMIAHERAAQTERGE